MKYIPFTAIVMIAIVIFAGFVVDGGGQVQARQQSITTAQAAARSGTNAAGGNAIDGDAFSLSPGAAINAAQGYIAAAGPDVTGSAAIDGQRIIVNVTTTYPTKLLSIIGITQLTGSATASARLVDAN